MTDSSSSTHIFSAPLALSSCNQIIYCSLHKVQSPRAFAQKLKEDGKLALINATRIISPSQLVAAANQTCHRQRPTWDTVFQAAGSSHLGHVMRDYAFMGDDNDDVPTEATVLIFMVGSKENDFTSLLDEYNVKDPLPLDVFFEEQQKTCAQQFRSWYKLTQAETEIASLEMSILTRIATKLYC